MRMLVVFVVALVLAGCGARSSENPSQMTSYTASETKSETAELFTLPAEQMAHVQVAPVAKARLPRVLRFTGSVAYNAFTTTPVFSAVRSSRNPRNVSK